MTLSNDDEKIPVNLPFINPPKNARDHGFIGAIFPERPTSKPGPDHRWRFEDGIYKCWDCPATYDPNGFATTVE